MGTSLGHYNFDIGEYLYNRKPKGECIAITTYCNTEEKIGILNKTIDNVKQYGLPIFIHAHYPLPNEIQKKVHSYFYSSDNPILSRFNSFWYTVENYKLEITVFDYYYTTLKGWDESIKILNDYDKIHIINYDTNLYPELFNFSKIYNKSLFLENPDAQKKYICPTYFCLNKQLYDFFRENITIDKYLAFSHKDQFIPLVELFVPSFLVGKDFLTIPHTEYSMDRLLEYDIASDTRFKWDTALQLKDTKIFIGDLNNVAHILFFNVTKDLNIGASVMRKGPFKEGMEMGGDMGSTITSDSLMSLYMPLDEIDNLLIKINGEKVSNDLIKKFIQLESKIYPL